MHAGQHDINQEPLVTITISQEDIEKTINEIEDVGLQSTIYWGFVQLNIDQLIDSMNRGGMDGRLIIN